MRVVILTMFKEGYGGGTGRVAYDMAEAFSKYHQVAFIRPADKTGIIERRKNLIVFGVESKGKGNVTLGFFTKKNKKALIDFLDSFNPDIIHANEPINFDSVLMKYAYEKGIPFLYTGHILPSKGVAFFFPAKAKVIERIFYYLIFKPYIKEFLKYCDGVIALNEFSKNDHKKFIDEEKLFVIPNGKDLDRYKKAKIPNIKEEEINLIYIGHIIPRKNQLYLVEMLKYLPKNFKLYLIGGTLNKLYLNKVKKLVRTYELEDRVIFTGQIEHKKIVKYLEKAHIFVSAATLEVQSLVILEALATGTPVIGLSNETIDELIINDYNGYRLEKTASPKEFAKKVLQLTALKDKEYKIMCKNCRETAKYFDWREVVKKMTQAYKAVKEKTQKPEKVPLGVKLIASSNEKMAISANIIFQMSKKIKGHFIGQVKNHFKKKIEI